MHIVFATYGSTGDVVPLWAFARECQRRGHRVTLAGPPSFAAQSERLGVPYAPLGPVLHPEEQRRLFAPLMASTDLADQIRATLPATVQHGPRMIAELGDVVRDADVLVSIPYQVAGQIVHERTGVPHVTVHFSPFARRARRFADASAPLINELRWQFGLPPLADPLGVDGISPRLALHPHSAALFRKPASWGAHQQVTGFLVLEQPVTPDADLERFVDGGVPPVVIGFGSMFHEDPDAVARVLVDAVARAGVRAVIQRGWSKLSPRDVPDDVHVTGDVPHGWLFPRASCVVHSGGAGVTGASVLAGVPSVVVPHWLDQHLYGSLLRERGVAADVIPFAALDATRLAHALRTALDEPRYALAAAALGDEVRREDGAALATTLLEQAMGVTS